MSSSIHFQHTQGSAFEPLLSLTLSVGHTLVLSLPIGLVLVCVTTCGRVGSRSAKSRGLRSPALSLGLQALKVHLRCGHRHSDFKVRSSAYIFAFGKFSFSFPTGTHSANLHTIFSNRN